MLKKITVFFSLFFLVLFLSLTVTWFASPLFREKIYIGALFLAPPPVQHWSADQLHDYPTRMSAISLILFVNMKYSSPTPKPDFESLGMDDEYEDLSEEEKREADRKLAELLLEWEESERERKENLPIAERAFFSLCRMTGHSFETHYIEEGSITGWGSLTDQQWQKAKRELNFWAFDVFGEDLWSEIESFLPVPLFLEVDLQ